MWKKVLCGIALTFSFVMNIAFAIELYYQYENSVTTIESDAPIVFECNGRPMEIV